MTGVLRPAIATTLCVMVLLLVPARAPFAGEPLPAPISAASASTDSPSAPPQEGDATAIEYGLIAALVAVVIITGLTALGTALNSKFDSVATTVTSTGGGTGGGTAPSGCPQGGTSQSAATHEPGGQTSSDASVVGDFGELGYASSTTTATSDFTNGVFTFTENAVVLNAAEASDFPNVKLEHELIWTLTLLAEAPPVGPPPTENAIARVDFSFSDLAWGIGGPVAQQDGVFEIEGPDGTVWGWTMEKNVSTGQLEITSTYGPAPGDFVFDDSGGQVDIQGQTFASEEVLRSVGVGPSFTFELPYGTPKDVTFAIRRKSHTVVPDPAPVPALPPAAQMALAMGLLLSAWMIRRRTRAGIRHEPGSRS